jgi:uncharacterized protein YkwD
MAFQWLERFHSQGICTVKPVSGNTRDSAQRVDVCAARLFTIVFFVAVVLSLNLLVVHAQAKTSNAERALFDTANHERAAQGLAQLRWDDALANAARQHALLMAQRNALSHQFPGESALQDRARLAGARFTEIAENVAEGPSADVIHSSWMHSPPHRANLLDPELTAVGIAIVGAASRDGAGRSGAGMLFAVEDFSQSVASLNIAEQERQVGAELAARGLHVANFGGAAFNRSNVNGSNLNGVKGSGSNGMQTVASRASVNAASANGSGAPKSNANGSIGNGASAIGTTEDARKTCEMGRGWSGNRPSLVIRYETGDLSRLPGDLEQKIQSGHFRAAAVGACDASSSRGFTRFRVAVLFYQ